MRNLKYFPKMYTYRRSDIMWTRGNAVREHERKKRCPKWWKNDEKFGLQKNPASPLVRLRQENILN